MLYFRESREGNERATSNEVSIYSRRNKAKQEIKNIFRCPSRAEKDYFSIFFTLTLLPSPSLSTRILFRSIAADISSALVSKPSEKTRTDKDQMEEKLLHLFREWVDVRKIMENFLFFYILFPSPWTRFFANCEIFRFLRHISHCRSTDDVTRHTQQECSAPNVVKCRRRRLPGYDSCSRRPFPAKDCQDEKKNPYHMKLHERRKKKTGKFL